MSTILVVLVIIYVIVAFYLGGKLIQEKANDKTKARLGLNQLGQIRRFDYDRTFKGGDSLNQTLGTRIFSETPQRGHLVCTNIDYGKLQHPARLGF